jgi:hypothetical protein
MWDECPQHSQHEGSLPVGASQKQQRPHQQPGGAVQPIACNQARVQGQRLQLRVSEAQWKRQKAGVAATHSTHPKQAGTLCLPRNSTPRTHTHMYTQQPHAKPLPLQEAPYQSQPVPDDLRPCHHLHCHILRWEQGVGDGRTLPPCPQLHKHRDQGVSASQENGRHEAVIPFSTRPCHV